MPGRRRRLLILGGTGEAAELAKAVAERWPAVETVVSLAGRTAAPPALPGQVRVGGFGGADGLAAYLSAQGFDAVVDATHPFAATMSAHARQACDRVGVPLLRLDREPWPRHPQDRWIEVEDAAQAASRLPGLGTRIFLAVGRKSLPAFAACKRQWFLVRLAEPPGERLTLSHCRVVVARGPFALEDEVALMRRNRIEVLVTKASGGPATAAKLEAARMLGVPVVVIRRPPPEAGPRATDVRGALEWLALRLGE